MDITQNLLPGLVSCAPCDAMSCCAGTEHNIIIQGPIVNSTLHARKRCNIIGARRDKIPRINFITQQLSAMNNFSLVSDAIKVPMCTVLREAADLESGTV